MDEKTIINDENHTLPKNTFREIPTPNPDAKEIVALRRENGKISGYKLSDGTTLSKEEAIPLAKEGGIKGVGVAVRHDEEYLKSLPDDNDDNNLTRLPTVE